MAVALVVQPRTDGINMVDVEGVLGRPESLLAQLHLPTLGHGLGPLRQDHLVLIDDRVDLREVVAEMSPEEATRQTRNQFPELGRQGFSSPRTILRLSCAAI